MTYDRIRHHRRSIRLKGYDYTRTGAFFVTICTQGRACLFGEIVGDEMQSNDCGRCAARWWEDIPHHFAGADIDAFAVMPNHIHGIILVTDAPVGAGFPRPDDHVPQTEGAGTAPLRWPWPGPQTAAAETVPLRRPSLGQVVAYFKYQSAKQINALRDTPGVPIWQRNYYEHIIRNQASLERIRQYIADNPARWGFDRENPAASSPEPKNIWFV